MNNHNDTDGASPLLPQRRGFGRLVLVGLIGAGFLASLYYFSWWAGERRYEDPLLVLFFLFAFVYVVAQVYFVWYIYLKARPPVLRAAPLPEGATVDVFVPTHREPLSIIEKAVRAAVEMHHPHVTYVLDDAHRPETEEAARRLGAVYLARDENTDSKAGNINYALGYSSGSHILVFDVDHIPDPDFIDRVLPYFTGPEVGVVQVALDHSNRYESFVAEASCEMNDDFFGATMLGMEAAGSASVFGSNSMFRREALADMGGYKPGLAEDLNTSIHLHAHGWKSAYAPEILARGLAPADLAAFVAQQYKWARGVFDVLFRVFPRLAGSLTNRQRVCYATRMTYYLAGPVVAVHLAGLLPASLSFRGNADILSYVAHGVPLAVFFLLTHIAANTIYAIKPPGDSIRWKGILLAVGSWPVYTAALLASAANLPARYIPTPKMPSKGSQVRFILPQAAYFVLLVGVMLLGRHAAGASVWMPAVFIPGVVLMHLGVVFALLPAREQGAEREAAPFPEI
ncbi:MAG: glycosyltransferase [Bacteroidota bacterium]